MLSFQYWFGSRRVLHFLCLSVLTCIFVLVQGSIAFGQDLSIFSSQAGTIPPEGVIRYGSIEATWVRSPLDGENLFQIAAPTVTDRKNLGPDDFPVEVRAQSVEALLQIEVERFQANVLKQLAHQLQIWNTESVTPRSAGVIISTLNNRPVIQIKSSDRSRPLTIITITQTDIDFYSETSEVLSGEWRDILRDEIDYIEKLSSPETSRRGLQQSLLIVVAMLVITGILGVLHWLAGWKRRSLQQQLEAASDLEAAADVDTESEPSPQQSDGAFSQQDNNASPVDAVLSDDVVSRKRLYFVNPLSELLAKRDRFLELLRKEPPLGQKLNALKFAQWLLVWLGIFVWYGGLIWLTYTFPMMRPWRNTLLREPFKLLLIGFVVNLALRINHTLVRRLAQANQSVSALFGEGQRKSLRANTIGGAIEGLVSVFIVLTGLILTLSTFGLSTQSVLAWGAVLGLVISFGTQSLIKDVVNGCLILFEDQFAVGDVVAISAVSGSVEEMSLRSTRLRNSEGQLITIPNGNIAEVRNLTRLWSRVDFTIEVAYENDPDKVLNLLNDVAQDLYAQPEWLEKMPNPPEVLGIERLSHSGILIRVWLKTAPLQQWVVGREYRLRVRRTFEAQGITIGKPQWVSHNTVLEPSSNHDGLIVANSQDKTKTWQTEAINYEAAYEIESEQD